MKKNLKMFSKKGDAGKPSSKMPMERESKKPMMFGKPMPARPTPPGMKMEAVEKRLNKKGF